jgi:membrane associated rhomboid family serine protease
MVLVPLYDKDPLERDTVPYVTYGLIALNLLVFLYELGLSADADDVFVVKYGFMAARFLADPLGGGWPAAATLVSYMFLHVGWMHLLGNMLFLFVFGDNIEDAVGHARFLVFYLLCGVAGAFMFMLPNPGSQVLLLGASGAIAGVVAAYLMLRPCAKIEMLIFVIPVAVDAYLALGGWILLQVWHILASTQNGTAWWAHGGGILAGALMIPLFRRRDVQLFQCVHPVDVLKQIVGTGGGRGSG